MIEIGEHSYGNIEYRGDANNIKIGKYTSISQGCVIDRGFQHRIDFVSTYPFNRLDSRIESNIEKSDDIIIGNDCWIGEDVMIFSGCVIGDGAVIGAKSLLAKNTMIGPYEVWAGVPAKFIKRRFNHFQIKKLTELKWWDKPHTEVMKIAYYLMSNNLDELFKLYNL